MRERPSIFEQIEWAEEIRQQSARRVDRFYAESDGGPGRRTFYVVDRYADPLSDNRRTDCESMGEARKLALTWNASPPWPVWDDIQAARDGNS